jgi:hypothetical protein
MVLTVTEDPSLSDGDRGRQRSAKEVLETPTTPEPILVDRLKAQGI